jgi:hypothetical protein
MSRDNVVAMITAKEIPSDIGPHEDRELELMLNGQKPLAMFTEISPIETGVIPEDEFAPFVQSGRLIMREVFEPTQGMPGRPEKLFIRRVLYAFPEEVWRIEAILLVCEIVARLQRWDEGLERVTGKLLGYSDRQIDVFIEKMSQKR